MKWNTSLVLILIVFSLASCKKEIFEDSEITAISIGKCFSERPDHAFLVRNTKEYGELKTLLATEKYPDCEQATLPTIDFEKHTLLGVFASGSGCAVGYDQLFYKHKGLVKYTYQVSVNMTGECNMYSSSMNWVLVPKMRWLNKPGHKNNVNLC
ncbi:MAG: hypothetical protein GY810_14945 [Aureispira sp.]|nr:hypothetical protein [Aureispira sp.]